MDSIAPEKTRIPNVLSIAGSDSSGGAGIQADLKTFNALNTYGCAVLTALTAQNTMGVNAIHIPPASFIRQQIESLLEDIEIDAIKIGMVPNKSCANEIRRALRDAAGNTLKAPIILDPVMYAKRGAQLVDHQAISATRDLLLPIADILTPNRYEVAALLDVPPPSSLEDLAAGAKQVRRFGSNYVLAKAGGLETERSDDVLYGPEGERVFEGRRIQTGATHGTGCTLSSAIAALIARGDNWISAIERAKHYLSEAMKHASLLKVGRGEGPLNHCWQHRVDN